VKRYFRRTFESLHNGNYRLFFFAQGVSCIGNWMQKVAQVWLVLELTDSGTLLGITAGLQQLPTLLLTPWGGLLADRVDRRKILLWTQSACAVPALILGALSALGAVTIWQIMALALLLGTVEAVDKPARHTFVGDLVDREHLTNAVALNNTLQNAGKVVGPALAGILISTVGVSATFLLNALSFGVVVVALLRIRVGRLRHREVSARQKGQLRDGVRYLRRTPELKGPLVLMAVTGMLAYEWTVSLPLLAHDTFNGDASVVGLFFTAMGAGAIFGGLATAGALRATPKVLIACGLLFSVVLLATSLAPTTAVALGSLFVLGAVSVTFRGLATSLIQLRSAPEMRGRMVAILIVAIGGTTPVGGPLVGWLAEQFGARIALGVGAVATAVSAVCTLLYLRRARAVSRVPSDEPPPTSTSLQAAAQADEEPWFSEGIGIEPDALTGSPKRESVGREQ
jgi:MFS family permease